jgi:peptidoglycan/LPS O-acetylase OafA/YrhL
VSDALERFGLDPLLAVVFFGLAIAGAWLLKLLIDRITPQANAASATTHKLASLEGLRGILAFAVVAHHACCWYYFTQNGDWTTGSNIVFGRLASFGVIQFFYLSGFLFWRKLMRRGAIPVRQFYWSRFVRIGPVYYCCVGAAIAFGLLIGGARLGVSVPSLLGSLLPWLLFCIGGLPDVNHMNILRITAGVTWTLALEWAFYLSLPFLAWFARRAWRLTFYAVAFGALFLIAQHLRDTSAETTTLYALAWGAAQYAKFMIIGFGGGILIATTERPLRERLGGTGSGASFIVAALFVAYLIIPGIASFGQILLLAAFALIVQGADLFGLLRSRPVRFMGAISYPVYLLHGMVYYAAMLLRGGIHAVSASAYLGETAVCLAAILAFATVLHVVVEQPSMRRSEEIARAATGAKLQS